MLLEDVLVAVQNPQGRKRFGAGVVVDTNVVLTCCHVVNAALGRALGEQSRPTAGVSVCPHFSPNEVFEAFLDEGADAWNPPPATTRLGADICRLKLRSFKGGSPLHVSEEDGLIRSEYRAAGYPTDWDGDLDIAIGEIVGREEHGLYMLRPSAAALASYFTEGNRLLGRSSRPTGVIHSGFSGGPVEVNGKVIGIIVEARTSPSQATAYMVPLWTIPRLTVKSHSEFTSRQQELAYIEQFALGPMVGETFLVTQELVRAYARAAGDRTKAVAILNHANLLRTAAGRSTEHEPIGLLELFELPNIDASPIAFWNESFLHACSKGPRMLASLLASVPEHLFSSEAQRDRSVLLGCLLENYGFGRQRVSQRD